MTRGFITIATGKEMYYQFAVNLLRSYRLFTEDPYPFAIMCDRENEYTKLFDDVVILEHPQNAFWDKFALLKHCPYDETIFIDSDCLAYADLNAYWDYFAAADDFTGCGTNYPIESEDGLFFQGSLGPYEGRVHWKPSIHGGLYIIRKGSTCDAIYEDCKYIAGHYQDFVWADYCAPNADEPVFCLAMAANGCRAADAEPSNYGIPWEVTEMSCDIFTGKLTYATAWHPKVEQGRMIHWSIRYCKKPLYRFEAEKLNIMLSLGYKPGTGSLKLSLKDTILYQWRLRYFYMLGIEFAQRVIRKIKRIWKKLHSKETVNV